MTRILRVGSNCAGCFAGLQLEIHRKQHDAGRRIRTEFDLDRGVEWFTLFRDGVESDGARGVGMADQGWSRSLRPGIVELDDADKNEQERQQESDIAHGAQCTTKPSADYADLSV